MSDIKTSIPKNRWAAHEHHCCKKHGCKYGDLDCPVVLGLIKQKYPCELCDIEDEQKKRKPDSNGVLPLTSEEISEFQKLVDSIAIIDVYIKNGRIEYKHQGRCCKYIATVFEVEAILWLAERFNLIGGE